MSNQKEQDLRRQQERLADEDHQMTDNRTEMVARWLYDQEFPDKDTWPKWDMLSEEERWAWSTDATELLALLDAERPVVAWEHEYECGHFDVEAGKDPVPWEMCPWACGANLKASRALTYKEANDG